VMFCACMVAFSIFQYFQIKEALSNLGVAENDVAYYQNVFNELVPYMATSIAVLGACAVVFFVFSYKLYLEFGWKIYKKIGADPRKRGNFLGLRR